MRTAENEIRGCGTSFSVFFCNGRITIKILLREDLKCSLGNLIYNWLRLSRPFVVIRPEFDPVTFCIVVGSEATGGQKRDHC